MRHIDMQMAVTFSRGINSSFLNKDEEEAAKGETRGAMFVSSFQHEGAARSLFYFLPFFISFSPPRTERAAPLGRKGRSSFYKLKAGFLSYARS